MRLSRLVTSAALSVVIASLPSCAVLVGDPDGHLLLGSADAQVVDASVRDATLASDASADSSLEALTDAPVDVQADGQADARADAALGDAQSPADVTTAADASQDAGSRYAATVLADHPLAYWRLGEAPGASTALDQTANLHTGLYRGDAATGAPDLLTGDLDTAAVFDGVGSGVALGTSAAFDLPAKAPFTIEAWVKPAANIDTASSYPRIFDRESGDGTHTWGYGLWLVDLTPAIARFDYQATKQVQWTAIAMGVTAPVGQVTYIAGTYDGTQQCIYVDGVSIVCVQDTLSMTSYPTLAAALGAEGPGQATPYYPFGGTVDEVAIYPVALPAARVLAHYNAGTGH